MTRMKKKKYPRLPRNPRLNPDSVVRSVRSVAPIYALDGHRAAALTDDGRNALYPLVCYESEP